MYNRAGIKFTAVALVAALAACSGGGSTGGGSQPGSSVLPSQPAKPQSTGFTYDTQTLKNSQLIGPATFGTLDIDVVPRMQNASGLIAYAQQANDRRSGMYRHFLTPKEIGDRFGASQADYEQARSYFKSHHLAVAGWPQRLLMHVSGKQADLEAAFGTKFGWYKNTSGTFIAPMQTPKLPVNVPVVGSSNIVREVSAYSNAYRVHAQGNGMQVGYSPQQIAAAFDYNGAYRDGYTGAGITVGIIGTGGISAADVPAYKAIYHLPGTGSVTPVYATDADNPGNSASGFTTPPPIVNFGGCPTFTSISPNARCNPEDGETQLDTETVAGLAYNSAIHYYLAYNPNDGCGAIGSACPAGTGIPLQGLGEADAEIQTAIANNDSDILSLSFGGAEQAMVGTEFNASGYGMEPLEFAALASEGVAVFVSSGDAGAEQCQVQNYQPAEDSVCASYPATDPNVVAVGGTNSPINSQGKFVGPLTGWGLQTTGGYSGSGGGVSAYFSLPWFQQSAKGITGSMRNIPDISLNGDGNTGTSVEMYADPNTGAYGSPYFFTFGGTSVATPEAAAMWALVLQACSTQATCRTATGAHSYRLGNPNAYFYKIYADAQQYKATFYDVKFGNNAQMISCIKSPSDNPDPNATPCPGPSIDPGYQANTGYDLVTGIGVPFARALIHAVVGV